MTIKTLSVPCPNCKKEVVMIPESTFRPFCSQRCQSIDFGDWIFENHRVEGESVNESTDNDFWSEELTYD